MDTVTKKETIYNNKDIKVQKIVILTIKLFLSREYMINLVLEIKNVFLKKIIRMIKKTLPLKKFHQKKFLKVKKKKIKQKII